MRETHSARQLWTALFVALLAPASTLPAALAKGGGLSWLAPMAVFPLALFVLWRLRALGDDGLAVAWRKKPAVLAVYYLWAGGLAALTAGGCADRLSRTDYEAAPVWLLSLALTLTAAYLIRKGPGAFFRAVRIFFFALAAVLALFFALGASRVKGANLALRDLDEICRAWEGLLPAAGSLAVGTLAAFFPRKREPGAGLGWKWLGLWCAVAAGLCLLVLGALGPRLTASLPLPFFLALQGMGLPGGFQRLEALGTAAWVLSDLTLLGLAALAGREMTGGRAWAPWPILAAAFLGGCFLPSAAVAGAGPWLLGADLLLGGVLPILLSLSAGEGEPGAGGISCG